MEDDTSNIYGRDPNEGSSQKRNRSANDCLIQSKKKSQHVYTPSPLNSNTPQQSNPRRSGTLPLKRVFSTVLGDITNTVHSSPSEPRSGVLNPSQSANKHGVYSTVKKSNREIPANNQSQNVFNNSGLTWQSDHTHISISESNTSRKRRCADIRPTNLENQFSEEASTHRGFSTTSSIHTEYINPFEDQGFHDYDISSEEEDTNFEAHSDSEATILTHENIPVPTVQGDQRAHVLKMAALFQNIFQDKPVKKGWTNTKRRGRPKKVKEESTSKKTVYIDEGDPTWKCPHCGALMWYGERLEKKKQNKNPKFSLCCGQGQVQLPLLKHSPEILRKLLTENDEVSRYYRENIRSFNMVFSFTSLGGKIDRSAPKGNGPKMVVLMGENYHLMGSLKPPPGGDPKFGQLYIVDTENEIQNRASIIGYF